MNHRGTENTEKKQSAFSKAFSVPSVPLWLSVLFLLLSSGFAELAVHQVQVSPPAAKSRVPAVTAQGRSLSPQAISAVDISADGKFITVGTMAFSHDANVWQFAPDGTVLAKRNFPPWAPMQVATFNGGRALAVGLAYSRVTSPEPTVWFGPTAALFNAPLKDQYAEPFSRQDSELSLLRYGAGDWREGWFVSHLGQSFMHGPDWVFRPPYSFFFGDARRKQVLLEGQMRAPNASRPVARMAASADGSRVALQWHTGVQRYALSPHVYGAQETDELSVWTVNPTRKAWASKLSDHLPVSPLPDPAVEFPELLADGFRLRPDTVLMGTVAGGLALNRDGSRVAMVEYAVHRSLRTGPAIGKWDPPIHALNFVPQQRGRLRVFDGEGKELLHEWLPEAGLFEIGFGGNPDEVWCWPSSWFARGMAGEPWLPVEPGAHTAYRVNIAKRAADALVFPDAVADCAANSTDGRVLVSCWDGQAYLASADGKVSGKWELGSPARLAWSVDGLFAVAGTAGGKLFRVERDGKPGWTQNIPVAQPPAIATPPAEVVADIPVHQAGRVAGGEHAYVGDMWLLKLGRDAVLVDAGGTSGFALSQARVRALGCERVTHVLHTHSHGDHAGGAYLWRAAGAKIVGPKSAALTLTWLMPMLTDYGIYPPRPLDVPLPLTRVGDETEFTVSGQKFRALFVPGHSFDLTVYMTELGGKRVAFTGDLGFERESDIVHRCWGDAEKARPVIKAIRDKLLAWKPDVVFTGHGVRPNGTEWVEDLLRRSEESLARAAVKGDSK